MKVFTLFTGFKSKLTHIGKTEPLHFFSLAIIIALDIFVLINLFQGLYLQKKQLNTPNEVIPYSCEKFFLIKTENKNYEKDKKISVIEYAIENNQYFSTVENKYASAIEIIENKNKEKVDKRCREIYAQALVLHNDSYLHSLIKEKENYQYEIDTIKNEISSYREEYDTMLLEKIANQEENNSLTKESAQTVKRKIDKNTEKISDIQKKIDRIEDSLLFDSHSQKLLQIISERQDGLEKTKSQLKFWYPLKKILVEMIFIFPLFLFFLWLYKRMLSKENSLISLISAHLLLVTLIPIICKIFEFLLKALPFHFFSDLLDLLEALNIVSLFNYILIGLGIILALGIIYFLQKKVFSSQRIWEKRIQKKECWSCGIKKANDVEQFCSFCGESQFKKCLYCNENKINKTKFCGNCGKEEK